MMLAGRAIVFASRCIALLVAFASSATTNAGYPSAPKS